jgi:Kef-type K+ transport system membrane component KefB
MRRVLLLSMLILTMLAMGSLVDLVQAAAGVSEFDSFYRTLMLGTTFASIGFVMIAASVAGNLAGLGNLPRVTGYIVAGVALGPHVLKVLSSGVVEDMKIFNTLAVALIALEAGLELRIDAIKKVGKSLLSIVLYKVPLSWLMIGGAFLLASPLMPASAGTLTTPMLISIALVLGSLGVGTSPAVSIAVISESAVKGRTPDIILSLAIFKDLVMIVMLAVSMAVAKVLLTEGAEMEVGIFLALGQKVFLSLVAGGILGSILIAYMRWIKWEVILVILIVAYGGVYISDLLHLKSLLVFIGAGFVVTNYSDLGHTLHKSLSLLALPVFIVFFTTAGAGLNLEQVWMVLPVAGILYVARALMLYVSVRLGGQLAGDSKAFSGNLWYGLISQAGVALGLLFIAMDELPAIRDPLEMVALALIALNLLTGPVLLRITLGRAGTVDGAPGGQRKGGRAPDALGGGTKGIMGGSQPAETLVEVPEEPYLKDVYDELYDELNAQIRYVKNAVIASWTDAAERRLRVLLVDAGQEQPSFHEAVRPIGMTRHAVELRGACRRLRDCLSELPGKSTHFIAFHHTELPMGASFEQKFLWLSQRILGGAGRAKRRVPVRLLARTTVEGTLVPCLSAMLVDLARTEATRIELLDRMNRDAHELKSEEERVALIRTRTQQIDLYCQEASGMLHNTLDAARQRCLFDLGRALRYSGTPVMRTREYVYVRVAARVDAAIKGLEKDGSGWDQVLVGVSGRARVRSVLLDIESALDWEMHTLIQKWASGARAQVLNLMSSVRGNLEAAIRRLSEESVGLNCEDMATLLDSIARGVDRAISTEALPRVDVLRQDEGGFVALSKHLHDMVDRLDETWTTVPHDYRIHDFTVPDTRFLSEVSLRSIARKHLARELEWAFDEADASSERLNDRVALRLGEVAAVVAYGLQTVSKELRAGGGLESSNARTLGVAQGSLVRAAKIASSVTKELEESLSSTPDTVRSVTHEAFQHTYQRALGESKDTTGFAKRGTLGKVNKLLLFTNATLQKSWKKGLGFVEDIYRRIIDSDAARDARVRVGIEKVSTSEISTDIQRFEPLPSQVDKLPYVLTKLFDPAALDTPQILVGAKEQRQMLDAAYRRYQEGRPVTMLLTGSAGSGKTSVAHVVMRRMTERRLIEAHLGPIERTETGFCSSVGAEAGAFEARTFDQLTEHLLEKRRTILLDGFEEVFERTAEGVAHIRRVLKLVASTRGMVCWIIAVNTPTARLLTRLCDLRAFFTDEIAFGPLDAEDIYEVIDARCRLSGFQIGWPEGRDAQAPFFQRLFPPRDDDARRRRYCERIAENADGNIRNALTLVVNGVVHVDNETMELEHIVPPRVTWFEQLGRDCHRILALVVVTGTTGREEALRSMRWAPERLDASISRLVNSGALVPMREQPERLQLRSGVWVSVVQELEARNLLLEGEDA